MAGTSSHTTFLEALRPLADIWTSFELRYSEVLQEGQWRNLLTRGTFGWETEPASMIDEVVVDDPTFRAGSKVVTAREGFDALAATESGELNLGGVRFRFDYISTRTGGNVTNPTRYGWTPWRIGRDGGLNNFGLGQLEGIQGFGLIGNGGMLRDEVTTEEWFRIRNLLLDGEPPYTGFEDFSTAFLGFEQGHTLDHVTAFDVRAVLATMFAEWTINEEGLFEVKVRSPPTIPASELKVVAALWGAETTDRLKLGCSTEIVDAAGWNLSSLKFPNKGYHWIDLHLVVRRGERDFLRLPLPSKGTVNPRLQPAFGLGRIWELLNETLEKGEGVKSSDRMEILVAWIFHLSGFLTMSIGLSALNAGENDLMAFDPYSNETLMIEVTSKDPLNKDKLTKLRRRTDSIASATANGRPRALAVVPDRDSFLPTEVEEAQRLSITLVPRPKLYRMLEQAQENDLPQDILKELLR
jgi:hypothetical protein